MLVFFLPLFSYRELRYLAVVSLDKIGRNLSDSFQIWAVHFFYVCFNFRSCLILSIIFYISTFFLSQGETGQKGQKGDSGLPGYDGIGQKVSC